MTVYLNDWAESGEAGMLSDFGIDQSALDGATVIVASYTNENYEGRAFVLFERDGKLFEVNGGHCSCFGLREQNYDLDSGTQWQPEEADPEALRHRYSQGWRADDESGVVVAVLAALDALAAELASSKEVAR